MLAEIGPPPGGVFRIGWHDDPDLLTVARFFNLSIEVISGNGLYLRP